jgi:LacI family transcriptional regulator
MSTRTTMADVARESGVSLMTVSRVINGKVDVSEETRQRVLEVIDRLDYRPSGIARSLATRRTGTLGLVVPDISNPFFSDVARGVTTAAYREDYNVFLCSSEEDSHRELDLLHSLEEKRIDGLILCSSRLNDDVLAAVLARFPSAVLVNRRSGNPNVGAVLADDESGARMLMAHLLSNGRSSIGFLAGPPMSHSGSARLRGYQAALAVAGLPYEDALVQPCAPVVSGGLDAALALLAAQPQISALFCYNDLAAVGALQACARLGLRVPDDVAVAGFDDIPLAALMTPPLTTCCVPRYELGVRATQMLLTQIDGRPGECCEAVVPVELIRRASAP